MPLSRRYRLSLVIGLLSLSLLAPLAAAASFPMLGEWEWGSIGGVFVIVAIVFLLAWAFPAVRRVTRSIPVLGQGSAPMVAVAALVIAMAVNPGSALDFGDDTAAPASAASFGGTTTVASLGSAGLFDSNLYESTSDVTFYAADLSTKSSISPTVKVFKPGVTEKAAFEGSAVAEYTAAMSSGKVEITGIQVQTMGCKIDVALDLANYYEEPIHRDQGICRDKNALGNNDVSLPTYYLKKIGTLSLAKTDTSLTCSAGSQCSYSLILRNSAADSYLMSPAVKFENVANATLDSVDPGGACQIVEKSSTQYIEFTGSQSEIGPLGTVTCPIKVTRSSGSADGSFKLTADDLFGKYDATAWNTNSNVRGATATSATTVTFA